MLLIVGAAFCFQTLVYGLKNALIISNTVKTATCGDFLVTSDLPYIVTRANLTNRVDVIPDSSFSLLNLFTKLFKDVPFTTHTVPSCSVDASPLPLGELS